jgi:hypothetical protein
MTCGGDALAMFKRVIRVDCHQNGPNEKDG